MRPSLDRDRIRTARVGWGVVQSTITAAGTVVPEFEQVIASPIDSRVMAIRQRPGAMLTVGQPDRQLFDVGATSKNALRESELSEERAELELQKLDKDVANIRERTQTQMEGLALEMSILAKERDEAQRRLERARIRADRDGVLTWVVRGLRP